MDSATAPRPFQQHRLKHLMQGNSTTCCIALLPACTLLLVHTTGCHTLQQLQGCIRSMWVTRGDPQVTAAGDEGGL